MIRILLLLVALAPLTALDQNDPFWSGYRKTLDMPGINGVYANGTQAIAWSQTAYWLTEDAGNRWTDARLPATSLVVGSPVSVIAQGLMLNKTSWIRTADGRLFDAAGNSGNALMGGLAITRIAADNNGTLYAERGDGQLTIAIVSGAAIAQAPGRIAAIFSNAATIISGQKLWSLSAGGAQQLADLRGNGPGNWPIQSGPGCAVWRDAQGAGWSIRDQALLNMGTLQGIHVICQGYWSWEDRALCLLNFGNRMDITSGRAKDNLRSGPWMKDAPANLKAVAGSLDPDQKDTRHRLIIATEDGLWVWRSR